MTILFGGSGVQPTLRGQPTNAWSLQGGNCKLIPTGAWNITPGLYSVVQEYDAITGIWRAIGSGLSGGSTKFINSDGGNWRISNQSGCIVGGIVTTAGAGYTTAPSVTSNVGSPKITAILGGAVNTSITVVNGGSGYVYPPIVLFDAPNVSGSSTYGVQATGHATISGGAVTAITVDDQGAGYTNTPNIYLQNDPRDTAGNGATATCTLTGSGTVTALVVTDFGNAITSTAVPTLTFSGTSTSGAAATANMNWSVLSYSATSVGGGYSSTVLVTSIDTGFTATAGSTTNPTFTSNLVRTRPCRIKAPLTGTTVTTVGQSVIDGGVFSGVPTLLPVGFSTGSQAVLAPTLGPIQDVSLLQPV